MTDLDARSNFAHVGITRDSHPVVPRGYRLVQRRTFLGRGDDVRSRAVGVVSEWGVKTRAGFRVKPQSPAALGAQFLITLGPIREPVEVSWTIDDPRLAGFGYSTLHGHPLRGEEAFLVEVDDSGQVWFVNRSVSRPASLGWLAIRPLLALAQSIFVRRYARVLRAASRPDGGSTLAP